MRIDAFLKTGIGLLSSAALTLTAFGAAQAAGIAVQHPAIGGGIVAPAAATGPRADIPANFHILHRGRLGGFTVLHSFTNADGSFPVGGLVEDIGGNLYGVAENGGSGDNGVVFKSTPAGVVSVLHAFAVTDGANPVAGVRDVVGDYEVTGHAFGVTSAGGAAGGGNVFSITTGGAFSALHSFSFTDGEVPAGRLLYFIDGNYYGTTSSGGVGNGTVFRISPSGVYTVVYTFSGTTDGGAPQGGLSASFTGLFCGRNLYGTTTTGGAYGAGTIYSISTSGVLTTLYSFNPATDGQTPLGELQTDFRGNLYGVTYAGGSGNAGTIFSIAANGSSFKDLYAFPGGTNPLGANPSAGLALALNGVFYGTTSSGGANGLGNVFSYSNGSVRSLHDFNGTDGATPEGRLLPSIDGNLYGTAANGGANGYGSLFALPLY